MDWNFKDISIAVIGDHNLDIDFVGEYSGLMSREKESLAIYSSGNDDVGYSGGGAGNIVEVLSAIGVGTIDPVGAWNPVVCDRSLSLYRRYMKLPGVDLKYMAEGYSTPAFIKFYMPSGHHVFRANIAAAPLSIETGREFLRNVERVWKEVDVIILADYDEDGRGLFCAKVMEQIQQKYLLVRESSPLILGMSRRRIQEFLKCDYLILNAKEMEAVGARQSIEVQAANLLQRTKAKKVIVTLEGRGCAVFAINQEQLAKVGRQFQAGDVYREDVWSDAVSGIIDACGAGDALVAVFAACLPSGYGTTMALQAGNAAARAEVKLLYGARELSLHQVKVEYQKLYGGDNCGSTSHEGG